MRLHFAALGLCAPLALACQHHRGGTDEPAVARAKEKSPAEVFRDNAKAVVRVETPFGDGTGFVVRKDGVVVTSHHLLTGERQARVVLPDGRRIRIERVLATDARNDLAVVAVAAADLPALELADRDRLVEGDEVITIGNGQRVRAPQVTEGVVSSVEDAGTASISARAIAGSGGAPVLGGDGRVVAIVNGAPREDLADGLTSVVPAAQLAPLLRKLAPGAGESMAEFGARTGADDSAPAPTITLDAAALAACPAPQRERARLDLQAAVEIALPVYVIGAHEAAFRVLEGAALRLGRELEDCRPFVEALESVVAEGRRQPTPSDGVRLLGELYEAAIQLLFSEEAATEDGLRS